MGLFRGVPVRAESVLEVLNVKLQAVDLRVARFVNVLLHSVLDGRVEILTHDAEGAKYLGIRVFLAYQLDEVNVFGGECFDPVRLALCVRSVVRAEVDNYQLG